MIISSQPNLVGSATSATPSSSTNPSSNPSSHTNPSAAAHMGDESVPSNCNCNVGVDLVGIGARQSPVPALEAPSPAPAPAPATSTNAGRDSLTRPASDESELNVGKVASPPSCLLGGLKLS
ncbi:uncharacterized protein LOC110177843 [Drosophila serrata]|uniref:uncharacterized protein LOC110177843 n=1 Tax=Drosophila serrata TaxID=7274 RepID=UPI000A1D2FA7|nr:uncharacterized protein LOC110177843 [Drosophila serrata]